MPTLMNLPRIALSSLVAVSSALLPAQSERSAVHEVAPGVPAIQEELRAIENVARHVGGGLPGQVERVWTELGGEAFPQ